MSSEPVSSGADLRCSAYSQLAGIDPIGTAGSHAGYLLVEWPLPWPRDLAEIAQLAPVAAAAVAAGLRLQGLVAGESQRRSVICYRSPAGPFRSYERRALVVEPGQVVEAALELAGAAAGAGGGDAGAGEGAGGPGAGKGELVARDLLVCTHGRRDRCCGSLGTTLAAAVGTRIGLGGGGRGVAGAEDGQGAAGRRADGASAPQVRLWRTSHTGGHRFAPTAIVLPEGTVWGLLGPEAMLQVLHRSGEPSEVLGHYRGCAGLPSPQLQALERAVIAERGWEVLAAGRHGSIEHQGPGRPREPDPAPLPAAALTGDGWAVATLDVEFLDGRTERYRGEVGVGRTVPIPECGEAVERSRKVEHELALRNFERLA